MSRIERSVAVAARPERVFGFVAAEWETDLAFAAGRSFDWSPRSPARLRRGFRVTFQGSLVGLDGPVELEVVECAEPEGWVAHSTAGAAFTWAWRFVDEGAVCRATQICDYRPSARWRRLLEWGVGRRRRADALRRSLERLKLLVERQESLERRRESGIADGRSRGNSQ